MQWCITEHFHPVESSEREILARKDSRRTFGIEIQKKERSGGIH